MALILDFAVIYYGYHCYGKIKEGATFVNIMFVIIELCSIVLAVFYSREVLRHGIRFKECELEFTGLDENNVFAYGDIKSIEIFKDTKASLKKNFVDRYSRLNFELKDGSSVAVELGLTTKRKLKKIEKEINSRIGEQNG